LFRRVRFLVLPALALALAASIISAQWADAAPGTAVTVAPANLITNGSFESPEIWQANSFVEYDAGSTAMPGWTVETGSVDLTGSGYWEAENGNQSVDLSGSSSGSIQQTVTTKPGQAYTLTWYIAGNTNCGQVVKTMQVSWDGTVIDSPEFDTAGYSNTDMGWTQLEIYVTATGTSSTVGFADATPDDSQCGATLDNVALVPAAISTPAFTQVQPVLKTLTGVLYSASFFAVGVPAYNLVGAPSWLSVDAYGAVTGTPPAGTRSFTYRVKASNADGSAVAGPYTVAVETAADISGTVTDGGLAYNPVSGATVQACVTASGTGNSVGECQQTATGTDGTYRVPAPIGVPVVVSAYPLPGSGDVTTSTNPLTVPGSGITGESISLDGITPLPNGVTVNGTTSPTVYWANPANVSVTGCANGMGTVSVIGPNTQTGAYSANVVQVAETPAGSGSYSGVIPPEEPVHGPVEIDTAVTCPPQSALLPDSGPATGGTPVFLNGSAFSGATGVSFGGTPAASYQVLSDQAIEAVAPPGAGTVSVVVTGSGLDVVAGQYTYTAIDSVSPATGPAAGGTTVVITGAGLGSATAVLFGKTGAEFTQVSSTQIDAVSPPGAGTADITVETLYGGTTPVSAADRFTYGPGRSVPAYAPQAAKSSAGFPSAYARLASWQAATHRSLPALPAGGRIATDSGPLTIEQMVDWSYQHIHSLPGVQDEINLLISGTESVIHLNCQTTQAATADAAAIAVAPVVAALAETVKYGAEIGLEAAFPAAAALLVNPWVQLALSRIFQGAASWLAGQVIAAAVKVVYAPFCPGNFNPNAKVDPSGAVLDTNGYPVKGATVTILRADTAAGPFTPEAPASSDIDPNVNPETTGADGVFHWDVVAGWYEVSASAPGCTAPGDPYQSTVTIGPYPVPPPQLGLTVTLACAREAPAPVPSVSGLSVSTGSPVGGTRVTVLGSNFTPASTVTFGKRAAKAVTYLSAQAIQVTSPAGRGLADIRVRTQGGRSPVVAADKFFFGTFPQVRRLSRASDPDTGGSPVTITGTGFTEITAVTFGGVPAASFSVRSATSIRAVVPAGLPGTVDLQVVNPAGVSPAVKADRFRYAGVTAYVVTSDGMVPINAVTGQATRAIEVKDATSVAIAPDGATAYVVSRASGTVTPVKLATGNAGKAITVGKQPAAIAVTPNGTTAYVANGGSGTVTPIRLSTGKAGKAITVGRQPDAIAIAPNGATAYVVNGGSGTVTPIRLSTGKAGKAIKVGADLDAIAITPSGKIAYIASTTGTVTPVTIATGKAGKAIKAGSDPAALATSPNGATLYVADRGTAKSHGSTVTPIATAAGKPGKTITVGSGPDAIVITPGGLSALVANYYSGTVTPLSLSTGTTSTAIKVGSKPTAIAITPLRQASARREADPRLLIREIHLPCLSHW